jgi:hypothetical protein
VTYPNGDQVAYVVTVYEAEVLSGTPRVTDGELSEVGWFTAAELQHVALNRLSRALLPAVGRAPIDLTAAHGTGRTGV